MTLSAWLLVGSLAGAETPDLPRPEGRPPPPPLPTADDVGFAADFHVGWTAGTWLSPSITPRATGSVLLRYDTFVTARDARGPRLGISLWGAFSTPPRQPWTPEAAAALSSEGADIDVDLTDTDLRVRRYGVMAVLRHDPAAPISADVGLGFGRVDLDASPWGRVALPAFTLEAGLRHRLVPNTPTFVAWTARGSWVETPGVLSGWEREEGWIIELGPALGVHLR